MTSTASGPLWQQRPYPAPGKILSASNGNNKKATTGSSIFMKKK